MKTTTNRFLTKREADYLKAILEARGTSFAEIARLSGISPIMLAEVGRRKYRVTPRIKEQFAKGGINLDEVMVDE